MTPGHDAWDVNAAPDLEPDVERLHRAILREPNDPEEGRERAPWWVWTAVVCAIFWGGWYLGRYGGSFDGATHVAFGRAGTSSGPAPRISSASGNSTALGKQLYARNCQACHQATGLGIPGAFPPLVGSAWAVSSPDTVGRILLNGLQGPVVVAGAPFNGAMPAWRDVMSDEEIAAVLTYVRQWAPNRGGSVSPEVIHALREATVDRKKPWTVADLSTEPMATRVPIAEPRPAPPTRRE
ncbi:MAG: hypothetical protein NVS4B3_28040 [Gemmatimonadaceae bacterium]